MRPYWSLWVPIGLYVSILILKTPFGSLFVYIRLDGFQ